MDPNDPGLLGIRAKLARAFHHLETLDAEMGEFANSGAICLSPPQFLAPNVVTFHLKLSKPMPIRWSVIMGEFVHDLRSALDNTVTLLTVEHGGSPKRSAFPVCNTEATFLQVRKSKIGDLPPRARTFVEALQPFASDAVIPHYLESLEEMWNADKHRIIQPWGVQLGPDRFEFKVGPETVQILESIYATGVLHDGDEVLRLTLNGPPTSLDPTPTSISFHVASETPNDPNSEYGGTFWSLYDGVASVIHGLLSMIHGSFPDHPLY